MRPSLLWLSFVLLTIAPALIPTEQAKSASAEKVALL